MDPISDQFAHVSTYNYAENSPIANIDLWGLQAYYAADGKFIGRVGDSEENRVVTDEVISSALGILIGYAQNSEETSSFLQENSTQGFGSADDAATSFGCQACTKDDVGSVEYGTKIGSKTVTNEDGSESTMFINGTEAIGDGESVNLAESKLPKGWKVEAGVHTHPNGERNEEFSPFWHPSFPTPGDKQVEGNVGGNLYLATPKGDLKVYNSKSRQERRVNIELPNYYKYTRKKR